MPMIRNLDVGGFFQPLLPYDPWMCRKQFSQDQTCSILLSCVLSVSCALSELYDSLVLPTDSML